MDKKIIISLWLVGLAAWSSADKDDKKWVWSGNTRGESRNFNGGVSVPRPPNRYNSYDDDNDYQPQSALNGHYFPPNLANQRPQSFEKPIYENRPPVSGVGFLSDNRPGGVYNSANRPSYGGSGPYIPEGENPAILTGPIPSWIREGPIKNFDKCKCTEKFNCNSPGISYGHCDVGKKYCCYSTKGDVGGPIPSKPVHSIENGVLVGPGGPVDSIPGVNNYPRPPKQIGSGFYRPGGLQGNYGHNGGSYNEFGGRPGAFNGVRGETNEYSPANGILIGPGGPYDRPGLDFVQGRSATDNKKA
ncbi:uncharacterized protein LOC143193316 [Rhynchophorus ferrugineus]|uniref:uncharacterized protein LOC143193316 n=1 Tax=Rhynchophorus ferrugineus TaxID=354439 RepID=UPI003FCD1FF9